MNQTESIFTEMGGVFCTPVSEFQTKLKKIRAFIFDWDGVFNNGTKNDQGSSVFNEVDAMGTNLLRFSYYLDKGEMPITTVMSGEKNVLSFQYGTREHFHALYYRVKNKKMAFDHFTAVHQLAPDEVAFMFDDVLDLSLAEVCGLKILINRTANPLFKNYVIKNNLADYVTARQGGDFAIREVCEMLIGLRGNYEATVQNRSHFTNQYDTYFQLRQQNPTSFFTWENNEIKEVPAQL